jgi:hypothetical protein
MDGFHTRRNTQNGSFNVVLVLAGKIYQTNGAGTEL